MNKLGYILLGIVVLVVVGIGAVWFFLFNTPSSAPEPQDETPEVLGHYEEQGAYYEIVGEYPSSVILETPQASEKAEAVLKDFVESEAETFKRDTGVESFTEEDVAMQNLGEDRKYALAIEYKEYGSEETASYVFSIFADTLGAHPNGYYRTFTFDKATGDTLTLSDLFPAESDYLSILSEKSRVILIPHIAEVSNTPEEELDTTYLESGTEPKADNFQWFYVTDTELVLIFPPYQVGPWALGTQTVELPRSELNI